MLSRFYQRHSALLLLLVIVSLPFLAGQANSLPQNNDIETWLPNGSSVRVDYERFKQEFGVEEVILVALDRKVVSAEMTEAVCARFERLPGVRQCWSPDRMRGAMGEMGVSDDEFMSRARGLAISNDGRWHALIALLSASGLKDRAGTVREIRRELGYCQLTGDEVLLSGGPVIVTELDRLGGQKESQKFFMITLLLCLGVLYYWLRDWKLSLCIMLLTVWAINLTLTIFKWSGGQMNFILGALSVMVTVFTIEACIHVLHYHNACLSERDPLQAAWLKSLKPCAMSMLTTAIGLYSVSVSDIIPVMQFGGAAALGAVVAMLTGLLLTPAVLVWTKHQTDFVDEQPGNTRLGRLGYWIIGNARPIVGFAAALTIVGISGLVQIRSRIDPLDFLPKSSPVLADLKRVEERLTNIDSIEAIVDFSAHDAAKGESAFVARLEKVRAVEKRLREHTAVRHTMSVTAFFPEQLPESPWQLAQLLRKAQAQQGRSEYISEDQSRWRISARINTPPGKTTYDVFCELQQLVNGEPVRLTGIAPLLQQAQHEIFSGFWQSFLSALGVIFLVMVASLRSFSLALLTIIPNLVPICVVFGILGWVGYPVDIGMMMSGSIALGITVDGTFHFLSRYEEAVKQGKLGGHAVRLALMNTGGPIFESIVVSSLGMLALSLSSFTPTIRFGVMMATLLMTALAGGLVLLPALLCLRGERIQRRGVHADGGGPGPMAPGHHLKKRPAKWVPGKVA
jgi:predicted RND superfamily exporter protein